MHVCTKYTYLFHTSTLLYIQDQEIGNRRAGTEWSITFPVHSVSDFYKLNMSSSFITQKQV